MYVVHMYVVHMCVVHMYVFHMYGVMFSHSNYYLIIISLISNFFQYFTNNLNRNMYGNLFG